jgi:predicted kinase
MKKVVLAVGIPGSGKTTLLKPWAAERGLVYVCPDDIREELTGAAINHSQDREAWDLARARVTAAFESGKDVVVDATFTNQRSRREFVRFARAAGAAKIFTLVFNISLDVAKERNQGRARVVSDEQLEMRHAHLTQNPPALADGFDAVYSLEQLAELEANLK